MPIEGQKNFNVNVNEKVADEFSAQIDERGYTKYMREVIRNIGQSRGQ